MIINKIYIFFLFFDFAFYVWKGDDYWGKREARI